MNAATGQGGGRVFRCRHAIGDKRSGVGRESARAEIHASLQTKMVRIDTEGTVAAPFVIR